MKSQLPDEEETVQKINSLVSFTARMIITLWQSFWKLIPAKYTKFTWLFIVGMIAKTFSWWGSIIVLVVAAIIFTLSYLNIIS